MRRTLTTIALTGMAGLALAGPALAAHEGTGYEADLVEVADNDPGSPSGSGTLQVSEDGETMTVTIEASGLGAVPHAMHIHAIVDGDEVTASSCPTIDLDGDDDGVVTVAEGAPAYGGIQVSLTTSGDTTPDSGLAVDRFPAGDTISYSRSGIAIPDALKPNLGKVHFVVHGVDEDGNGELTADQEETSSIDETLPREATLPALCGTLTAAGGRVDTGDGATQDATSAGLVALGASALVAGAVTGLRRRGTANDA